MVHFRSVLQLVLALRSVQDGCGRDKQPHVLYTCPTRVCQSCQTHVCQPCHCSTKRLKPSVGTHICAGRMWQRQAHPTHMSITFVPIMSLSPKQATTAFRIFTEKFASRTIRISTKMMMMMALQKAIRCVQAK